MPTTRDIFRNMSHTLPHLASRHSHASEAGIALSPTAAAPSRIRSADLNIFLPSRSFFPPLLLPIWRNLSPFTRPRCQFVLDAAPQTAAPRPTLKLNSLLVFSQVILNPELSYRCEAHHTLRCFSRVMTGPEHTPRHRTEKLKK